MKKTFEYLPNLGRSVHLVLSFNFNCSISGSLRSFDKYNFNKSNYPACRENIDWSKSCRGWACLNHGKALQKKIVDVIRNYISVS